MLICMRKGFQTGRGRNKMKLKQGFTLMEMLVVVGIIAVLIAIAIPVMAGTMHKAKVATDMANVRAYYAELQVDYLETGEYLPKSVVPYVHDVVSDYMTIKFPKSGETAKLQEGNYFVDKNSNGAGYSLIYHCKKIHVAGHEEHELLLE